MLGRARVGGVMGGVRAWRQLKTFAVQRGPQEDAHDGKTSVFELRTYSLYPEKVKEFLRVTQEEFHLRERHSRPLGYWTTELGGLNQVVHLWEYESLEHRADVRTGLGQDAEWLGRYVGRVVGMWQHQDNTLLLPLPGAAPPLPTAPPSAPGVYELQTLQLRGSPGVWSPPLLAYVRACQEACGSSQLVGAWRAVVGARGGAALLWRHPRQDSCLALAAAAAALPQGAALDSHVTSGHNKILLPHPVSPLQ